MKNLLTDYCQYNNWANRQWTDFLRMCPDSIFEKEIVSSFPSIRLTLLHIWDAETIWLERLNGRTPKVFPSHTFNGSNDELLDGMVAASEGFKAFVAQMTEVDLSKSMTYHTIKSGQFTTSVADMILHCMNHSTYHRGQLTTLVRQLGLTDLPSTDFIKYKRG